MCEPQNNRPENVTISHTGDWKFGLHTTTMMSFISPVWRLKNFKTSMCNCASVHMAFTPRSSDFARWNTHRLYVWRVMIAVAITEYRNPASDTDSLVTTVSASLSCRRRYVTGLLGHWIKGFSAHWSWLNNLHFHAFANRQVTFERRRFGACS